MAPNGLIPNGTAEAPIEISAVPSIVGINFGNSYASIAVLTKEGIAECIANEDGERQIACAIAFQGEEMYIGNQARHQLVKNSQNTITGFRNLLGKKFSEVPQAALSVSAPVIQHPSLPDTPAYKVKVLQPAPLPLKTTATNTPAASQVATPRSEPIEVERVLTVSEVTTIFLGSLVQSAEDFLGRKVLGAVISLPSWFDDAQREAVIKAAEDAGVHVLQLLDDAGAVAVCTAAGSEEISSDRTQLIVDLGASSLELSLLSVREGLAYSLATISDSSVGGDEIDSKLIKFFAKEFTKKTKTPLTVAPASDPLDKRAEAKLRLAVEHTKRTLSASPGAATCSVESLKDGLDYTGSINRLRFDMEVRSIYDKVYAKVKELVASAGVDLYDVDEIVYIGGCACLPGLDETLAEGFTENVITPFKAGTVAGGGIGDPTTILARGCALQAQLLVGLAGETEEVRQAFIKGNGTSSVSATSRTIGLLVPQLSAEGGLGGVWVPLILKETPLPCRRTVTVEVDVSGSEDRVGFEFWEVSEGVRVEHVKPQKFEDDEDEPQDEEEEELEVKEKTISKEAFLASLSLSRSNPSKGKTKVQVQAIISGNGAVDLSIREVTKNGLGEAVTVTVGSS
ncbi:Hsp70 protein-domain-containing protein [Suillus fuscotomentosus]|uniref:Hsp70 protein-domain-containing protein n=1 Tax=Suillus fuscotomentosus TaxID=1912939 RepID=A0AAD4DYC4_9AGAM|nr:Hsp70 protein-domain-containing protein [Suillus fuscotomentosus]KAG1896361.1 Hsp70 protein-domain-containing protein [Suillus fuscotomentosus]